MGTYIVYMNTPAEEVIQVDTQIPARCDLLSFLDTFTSVSGYN